MPSPWFFTRLGIAPVSDVKAIKRAYARALKEVDQLAERESFENLREAYEQALAWAAQQDVGAVSDRTRPADATTDVPDASDLDGGLRDDDLDDDDDDLDDEPAEDDDRHEPNPTWTAINEWIARLTEPGSESLDRLLDQALDDPRLWHLDGRRQFEAQLIRAIHRSPLDKAALFECASMRFDWAARRASSARSHPQDVWVSRVIDQALLWESLAAPARRKLAAALKAVRATEQPSHREAFRHRPALQTLRGDFHEWSTLFVSAERVDAWQRAYDRLPANDLRRLRAERGAVAIVAWVWRVFMAIFRFLRDQIFDTWLYRLAGGFLLVCFIGTWLAGGFDGDHRSAAEQATANVMRIAQANAKRVGAYGPREAGRPVPVPLHELPGRLDRRACRATHAVLHQRNPEVFDDAELIASLSTHAALCSVNYRWPAMADPILRCLELESWSANNERRPQNHGHCVRAEARPRPQPKPQPQP